MSPDGMYYWDGQAWKSTLSPDGRFRWDGSSWVPLASAPATPYAIGPPRREPTSWTRPLQYAVAGWYVWSIIYSLVEPLWLGRTMTSAFDLSLQRSQQANPEVSPPPAGFTDFFSNLMNVTLWVEVVIFSIAFAVIIVGAWKRWTWMYYVVLVLLGLTSILVPVQLVSIFISPSVNARNAFSMPSWIYPLNFVTGLVAVGIFGWMLVALVKRGPWAMRRPDFT